MGADVRIVSQRGEDNGDRVYQLSSQPDAAWWQDFHAIADRRLAEVGVHPSASIETGHADDELRISGITPDTSVAADQWLARVISGANSEVRVSMRDRD